MISLLDACVCEHPGPGRSWKIERDEDTGYFYHVVCGFGFITNMMYSCTDCGNPFISGRWLRVCHPSHDGTEYQLLFAALYDEVMCPECREYYGYQEIAGSWSIR